MAFALTGAGKLSAAPAVGVSLASNQISRDVNASLSNFAATTLPGAISISSSTGGSITSKSVAVAISVSASDWTALGLSGGGANSFNTITGNNTALVNAVNVSDALASGSSGVFSINATDTSSISATVDAIAASFTVGNSGAAAAIGVSLARNFIGETQGNSGLTGGDPRPFVNNQGGNGNLVAAQLTNSAVTRRSSVSINASNNSTIKSYVDSFSAAIGLGAASFGVALSGAGSESTNRSLVNVKASVDGGSVAKSVNLTSGLSVVATDASSVEATSWGAAIGFSLSGGTAISASIGVSLARNTINNTVTAGLANLSSGSSVGGLSIYAKKNKAASKDSNFKATSAAVSLAISGGSSGLSLAGGGADAINTALGDTTLSVNNVNLSSNGLVDILASNDQLASAGVGAGVGAGSFAATGGQLLWVQLRFKIYWV